MPELPPVSPASFFSSEFPRILYKARLARENANQHKPPYSTQEIMKAHPRIGVTELDIANPDVHEIASIERGQALLIYNVNLPVEVQRLAVAHGLGHHLFDLQPRKVGESTISYTCGLELTMTPMERRAEIFAGELLAPFAFLNDYLGSINLAPTNDVDLRILEEGVVAAAKCFEVPIALIESKLNDLRVLRGTTFYGAAPAHPLPFAWRLSR